jgi:nucleoside diphosphate kinase
MECFSLSCFQVWEGNGVVASARKLIGATNPLAAEPGTIRGDFAIEVRAAAAAAAIRCSKELAQQSQHADRDVAKQWHRIAAMHSIK